MSIFDDAKKYISCSLIEQYFAVPGSKWQNTQKHGRIFYTLSPLREDTNIKSGTFGILENGGYKDLKTGESGDFIDLVAKKYGLSTRKAAQKIIDDSGGIVQKPKSETNKKIIPAVIAPQTEETEKLITKKANEKYFLDKYGIPTRFFKYINYKNEWIMCVVLYIQETDKEKINKNLIPFYYTGKKTLSKTGRIYAWNAGRPDNLQIPLYGEHKLKNNKKDVLFVEGEKCASIKNEDLLKKYTLVTWIGGTANVYSIDYVFLRKYFKDNLTIKAVFWPDNDDAGRKAMSHIKNEIALRKDRVKILDIPKEKASTWDIADAEEEGIDLVKFINECSALFKDVPETTWDCFVKAIDYLYGSDNIAQYNERFYIYDEKDHYWKYRLRATIENDIQKFIELFLIYFLTTNDIKIHTYINNVKSYIKNYAREIFYIDPFKEAALKPFIHLKNCSIELKGGEFITHFRKDKEEIFFRELFPTDCLNIDYDSKYTEKLQMQKLRETAPCFYKFLNDVIPEGERNPIALQKTILFFCEIIGYVLIPEKLRPYFFAFYGRQDSGKTFFVEIIKNLISKDFVIERSLKELNDKHAKAQFVNKKMFVDDDVKSGITIPDDLLKSLTGSKDITVEEKYKNPLAGVKISLAIFLLSNHQFQTQGGIEGIERRMIYCNFKNTIKNPDLYMLKKICGEHPHENGKIFDERPAILGAVLYCIKHFIRNNFTFTTPEWVKKDRGEWVMHSSSYLQFLHEEIFPNVDDYTYSNEMKTSEMYDKYKQWGDDTGNKKLYGRNSFHEKMRQHDCLIHTRTRDGEFYKIRLPDEYKKEKKVEQGESFEIDL